MKPPTQSTALDAVDSPESGDRERAVLARCLAAVPAVLPPVAVGLSTLFAWDALVRFGKIPSYILPGPMLVAMTLVADWDLLSHSLLVTLRITFMALAVAVGLGVALAVLFSESKWIERALLPYAVAIQVIPVVAIAPLIVIYVHNIEIALLIVAWVVAFFPILSNTTVGLHSADHNLLDLFQIYGASRMQTLRRLKLPAAMPYFLAGLRISGGLSLIGAIVAEFVAGTGGRESGLAYRLLEASYQLRIPRMYAALFLICATGLILFAILSGISHLCLSRWHESAMRRER